MYTFGMSTHNDSVRNLLVKLGYTEEKNKEIAPDFLVFTGGADVTPSLYFQEPHRATYSDLQRDYNDLCNLAAARLRSIPCVGICRGAQFLHVSLGGTLIQDIAGHAGSIHDLLDENGKVITGWEGLKVNSTHHQAIPLEESDNYDEVFTSPELTVEAFADYERRTIGFQFHPEYANCPELGVKFFTEMLKEQLGDML